jgi:hypothetical protein
MVNRQCQRREFPWGMPAVSLALTVVCKLDFQPLFELTNKVTASFTSVGNEADFIQGREPLAALTI